MDRFVPANVMIYLRIVIPLYVRDRERGARRWKVDVFVIVIDSSPQLCPLPPARTGPGECDDTAAEAYVVRPRATRARVIFVFPGERQLVTRAEAGCAKSMATIRLLMFGTPAKSVVPTGNGAPAPTRLTRA